MAEKLTQVNTRQTASPQDEKRIVEEVLAALRGLRFGSVEITVHEGKVTFIERKEKVRLT
ncbi:MAG TPA: DUF2292 domain-containing protein [Methylophilaceae bacterium]|nr:DUF2292 domain-containing protein [Methylophilaceae bacterium]HQR61157.1 DUF2292 domain-containing protein [Methylophilaceae bacterium]